MAKRAIAILTLLLHILLMVEKSFPFVHLRSPVDVDAAYDVATLDDITRRLEHTTKWEEARENVYLQGIQKKRAGESKRTPVYLHQKFSKLNQRSKQLAMLARISENVTHIFGKRQILSMAPNSMSDMCRMAGMNYTFKDCPLSTRLRTFDGACNNLVHVNLGKAIAPFQRFLPPDYADGIQEPRRSVTGEPLPSARVVSANIMHFEVVLVPTYTVIISHFGQILDHDISSSGTDARQCEEEDCEESPFCMPLMVAPDDPFFRRRCIPFVRSVPSPAVDCMPGGRQQLNQVTSFIDSSQTYGSSTSEADALRDKSGRGLLGSLDDPSNSLNQPLLPHDEEHRDCLFERTDRKCGMAGDARAAEQPGLTAMHTLFLRMHNAIASQLARENPGWDGERLYQEARRIVSASWQHIVYNEYLPTLLGRATMLAHGLRVHPTARFFGYDVDVDPMISNVFSSAAFRFGHSQVPPNLTRLDADYREVFPPLPLAEAYFNATHVFDEENGGLDSIIRGMTQQLVAKVDGYITIFLTRHLFATPAYSEGLDLGALNVQRGRDHGLPSYNAWRQWCGLRRARSFNDLANEFEVGSLVKFQRTYSKVDDIDLFVALISERAMRGSLVGPTVACLLGRQFNRLKFGDRFWYETASGEQAFTESQLQEIRKVTMARVICDHTNDVRTIQPLIFRSPQQPPSPPGAETSFYEYSRLQVFPDIDGVLPGFSNVRVPCTDQAIIPRMSLEPWREPQSGKREAAIDATSDIQPTKKEKAPWWYRLPDSSNKKALELQRKRRSLEKGLLPKE